MNINRLTTFKVLNFILIVGSFFFMRNECPAQTLYSYDAAGNRIQGTIYVGPPNANRNFNPSIDNDIPTAGDRALFNATKFGIRIFPTLISDVLNITISSASAQNLAQVFVFDNNGKALINTEINNPSPNQLNFGSIRNGIYNIKVLMGGEQVFYKVVKAN